MIPRASILGVVLAGGLGRRMGGGDKPLVEVGGRPMLDRVVERLSPQVARAIINANGDPGRFASYGLPVIPDTVPDFAGPLAGILAGISWARENAPGASHVLSVAADTPFFPADLAGKLADAAADRPDAIALAASAAGTHPVFALWPISLHEDLERFLAEGSSGKILAFVDRHNRIDVMFPDIETGAGERIDPFFNVNTPDDAARAEAIAALLSAAA